MDYFKLYEIPVGFKVDARALKRKFHALSKTYHPDFHTDKSEEEQARILELSSFNNKAYQTLKDFDLRMKYILDSKNLLEEGKGKLPQSFLMEMMEINEVIMELEFEGDMSKLKSTREGINQMKINSLAAIEPIIENYDDETATEEDLFFLKNYYLKNRYMLRIQENLNKFATA